MPFMTGYMLGSLGGGGHYHTTSVYYPAGSWRSSSDTRALVPSGGFGYSSATASRPIGYVARSSTALSPIGGFGSRSTVIAPTATGAPPAASAILSADSPTAMLVAPSARSSSFGTMTAPSSRGGFGMSAGSHSSGFGGAHSGIST
jgi:hypothetical protein